VDDKPPTLSGATDGTLGPQVPDATYITGVNTLGVRVNWLVASPGNERLYP